jgi:hypothetical protein
MASDAGDRSAMLSVDVAHFVTRRWAVRPEPLMINAQTAISAAGTNANEEKNQTRPENPREGNANRGGNRMHL